MLDLRFELLSAYFQPGFETCRPGPYGGKRLHWRALWRLPTSDGYLALAMIPLPRLGSLLGFDELHAYADQRSSWEDRPKVAQLLARCLSSKPTQYWVDILEPADIWCAPVLTLAALVGTDAFQDLEMVQ